jgi:hypothetical protein
VLFGFKITTFLGHIVDYTKFQLHPRKVITVMNFPTPKKTTNVKAFLGLTRYCRRFIAKYAKIVEPLFTLTKKECKFLWTPICQAPFVVLKKRLAKTPIIIKLDFNKPFILDVD